MVGVLIGLMLSFVLFRNRGCTNWLPGNQVRKELTANPVYHNDLAGCKMECFGLNDDLMFTGAEEGEVLFNESLVHQKPRVYMIEFENNNRTYKAMYEIRDTASVVIDILPQDTSLPCACR
ncbi:MAG: hypothetical protein RL226_2120 [Bacteroidota bacterium]